MVGRREAGGVVTRRTREVQGDDVVQEMTRRSQLVIAALRRSRANILAERARLNRLWCKLAALRDTLILLGEAESGGP